MTLILFFFAIDVNRYHISTNTASWQDARIKCQIMGGDLVNLNTRIEFIEFGFMLTENKYWIGLKRESSEWQWTDGSTIGAFTDWKPGSPVGSKGACGHLNMHSGAYRWDNVGCGALLNYVCEIPGEWECFSLSLRSELLLFCNGVLKSSNFAIICYLLSY